MSYSIDTSALMDGWLRYYPPEVFERLWERMDELIDEGRLLAVDEVLREIEQKDDSLLAWAKERPALFVPIDEA